MHVSWSLRNKTNVYVTCTLNSNHGLVLTVHLYCLRVTCSTCFTVANVYCIFSIVLEHFNGLSYFMVPHDSYMESITVTVCTCNCCNKAKTSSKASGGWTPNGTKIRLIKMYPNTGGMLTPTRARKSVKKVMLASFSLVCTLLCAWGYDLILYCLCFHWWTVLYVHHHGNTAAHYLY